MCSCGFFFKQKTLIFSFMKAFVVCTNLNCHGEAILTMHQHMLMEKLEKHLSRNKDGFRWGSGDSFDSKFHFHENCFVNFGIPSLS